MMSVSYNDVIIIDFKKKFFIRLYDFFKVTGLFWEVNFFI